MAARPMLLLALLLAVCHAKAPATLLYEAKATGGAECVHSPSVWCGSAETAEACGVLEQCRRALVPIADAPPVNVTLYMESLCPDCKAFFKNQFYPTWQRLGATGILNVDVVPYGNAREHINGHRWEFQCQHGEAECEGNQIATCAIGLQRSPSRWMPFLACLEAAATAGNVLQVAQHCATTNNVSFPHINTCSHNEWGDMLQHHMAVRTEKLQPPHTYVPWVTVNGAHSEEIQKQAEGNLLQLVCNTYRGTKPKECGGGSRRCRRGVE